MPAPYNPNDPVSRALWYLHEAVGSENDRAGGTTLERYAADAGTTKEHMLLRLRADPTGYSNQLDKMRQVSSLHRVRYEPAVASDFPPGIWERVVEPLILLRVVDLPGKSTRQTDRYAFAILASGEVVVSNEMNGRDSKINPWGSVGLPPA